MSRAVYLLALISLAPLAPAAELKVGDPAPALKISKWVSGKPVAIADGKDKNVYVVEFWATWCGPCRQSIPHLSKLAQHFEKAGVVVIGVSVDDEKTRDKVAPFVKDMGKNMSYTVALDDDGATSEAFMDAAGVKGIPHAFVVGKDGKLAWLGHPMDGLGLKLAELTGDKGFADAEKKHMDLMTKLRGALQKEKWDEALTATEALLALDPEDMGLRFFRYQALATKKKDAEAAAKCGREIVEKLDSADGLNEFAWNILTDDDYENARDVKLALSAAKKANDISKGESYAVLDTYARALFDTGDAKQAVEAQKKAVALAKKAAVEDEALKALESALEKYEKGPAKPDAGKDSKKE